MSGFVIAGNVSGAIELAVPETAGTNTITLPARTGTVITSADTGSVTNTMLAGAIPNSKLQNSTITIGSTTVALGGTMAALDAGIGTNQTWLNVTSSRARSTTYTNSTGRPIQVNVVVSLNLAIASATLYVSDIPVSSVGRSADNGGLNTSISGTLTAIVPPGATYSVTANAGTISVWAELR